MTLVGLVAVLVVIGVVLWLIQTQLPIAPQFRSLITVVVVLVTCLWLLQALGLLSAGPVIRLR